MNEIDVSSHEEIHIEITSDGRFRLSIGRTAYLLKLVDGAHLIHRIKTLINLHLGIK